MSVVRVGATKQYSDNWENIFSGGSRKSPLTATKTAAKSARASTKKKTAKKKAAKTAAKKSRRK